MSRNNGIRSYISVCTYLFKSICFIFIMFNCNLRNEKQTNQNESRKKLIFSKIISIQKELVKINLSGL